jgi:methylenetetrahydrofolate reductase (NADPH)
LEFFASRENLNQLVEACKSIPSIQFHAVNLQGESITNTTHNTTAVTWGVFPGREILQPTVVDTESFLAWKDEAFGLWRSWSHICPEDSPSCAVFEQIMNSYFLVNMVDNNFIDGDIFKVFEIINKAASSN